MPNTDVGKILFLAGQIDSKVDILDEKVNKINGSIKNHERRLTIIETTDEVEDKVNEQYIKKHQRWRTGIFTAIGLMYGGLTIYDRLFS